MVDTQDLVTGIRWELLELISAGPCTGSELAQSLGTSPANVSQHLKLLELGGLVKKERANGKSSHFVLAKTLALVTLLDRPAYRGTVVLDPMRAIELRLLLDNEPRSKTLRRFLAQYDELAHGFSAFGTIREMKDGEEVQILVIADDVKALRKEYANLNLNPGRLVIWSHTPGEFQEGLNRGESYFTDMIKNLSIVFDPDGILKHWKAAIPNSAVRGGVTLVSTQKTVRHRTTTQGQREGHEEEASNE